jgi:hypothetical protein
MSPDQIHLFPVLNQGLFSTNFLNTKFLDLPLWAETPGLQDRVRAAQSRIGNAYDEARQAGVFETRDEQKTEDKFIRPVLAALGWVYDPQPRHRRGQRRVRPDYALFANKDHYQQAGQVPDQSKAYYSLAETIAEAKYWGRPLNDTVREDPLDASDATAQLVRYLDEVYYHTDGKLLWGVLTNGKLWRLFSHRAASRSTNYYEVDLETLIQTEDPRDFLRFYGFFSREALTADPLSGKRWVDLFLEESDRAARAVSDHLKDVIFDQVLLRAAEGFLAYRRAEKGITQEDEASLRLVFSSTIMFLFRLLFLLYAESRDLLPVHDQLGYRRKSLQALKEEIWQDLHVGIRHSEQSFDYWEHLTRLFRIVDKGDHALSVPHYNGGLFHQVRRAANGLALEAQASRFLAEHKLADPYLAETIKALTFDLEAESGDRRFIDYSALGVRHLGDVYEGLLEFQLRQDTGGRVTLEDSNRERKESGTYFTPHFIVEFIVERAVGPAMNKRLDEVERHLEQWQVLYARRTRSQSSQTIRALQDQLDALRRTIFQALFGVKVLDPTMGSAHFLVHTVDHLTDRIVSFLAKHTGNPVIASLERIRKALLADLKAQRLNEAEISRIASKLTEVNLIKRLVMKRCVFGVDLNPMAVELAKLSLWLNSFTLGAPLSFLDHHLKCGNTLVGTSIEPVQRALAPDLFGNRFAGMLQATDAMREIGELTDATVAEVEESESKYVNAVEALAPFKALLDLWEAELFGLDGARDALRDPAEAEAIDQVLKGQGRKKTAKELIERGRAIATDQRFLHWELAFPEVWFAGGRRLDQPGFDAVIGNPPWVRQETIKDLKKVLSGAFPQVFDGVADIYTYVMARGLEVLKPGGRLGFIIPNKWLRANYGEPLRKFLTSAYQPELLVDFGHAPLFPEADTFPLVAVIRKPVVEEQPGGTLTVCPVPRDQLDDIKLAPYVDKHSFGVPTILLRPEGWPLEPPDVLRLFEKIKNSGRPLKEVVGDVPYRGVVTGLNEAFFIDQATRDRLIAEDPNCERLIKRLLRGRNIQRWTPEWEKEWLIFAHHGIEIDRYPSIKAHLAKFREALEPRPDSWDSKRDGDWPGRKPGIYKWYELQDPVDYHQKFESPKIVYQDIQFHSMYALDYQGCYLNNTGYFLPNGNLYLASLLNSSLLWWFNFRYLPHGKDEALRAFSFLVESIPIAVAPGMEEGKIVKLAELLIERARGFNACRTSFKQWLLHETALEKLSDALESPWRLNSDEFLNALKRAGFKRATPATLNHIRQTFERETSAMRQNRTEALRLEKELDGLILQAYKLTTGEIALLRQTAPPRSPIHVLQADVG